MTCDRWLQGMRRRPRSLRSTLCCSVVERLTNPSSAGYKEGVVSIRARAANCCCCMEALRAPELTVVTR